MINRRLATRFTHLQIERVLRVETIAELMSAQVGRTIRQVMGKRNPQGISDELAQLPNRLSRIADTAFVRLARWSHRATVSVLVGTLPRKWFRAVNPATVLVGEDVGDGDNTFLIGDGTGPIVGKRLDDEEWEAWVQEHVWPPPSEERVREIVRRPTMGQTWEQRIEKLSRLIEPEITAMKLTDAFSEGQNVDQIAREILPHIDGNIRASAKRIARTEGLRIANTMQREMYEDLGDLMVGTQILATLDEHTRPHHAIRNGRIHYNDRRRQPNVDTLPVLPDEPNCRCFDVPVMKMPDEVKNDPKLAAEFQNADGDAIPDPTVYNEWFSKADESRRMLAVGKRRYNEVKKKLGREPDWLDFVDPEGRLVPTERLKNETAEKRNARRQEVQFVIDERRQMIADIRASGFELPRPKRKRRKKKPPEIVQPVQPVKPKKNTPDANGGPDSVQPKEDRKAILQRIAARPLKDRLKKRRTVKKPQDELAISKDRVDLVQKKMKEQAGRAEQIRKAFLDAVPDDKLDRDDFRKRQEELRKERRKIPPNHERLKELRSSFREDAIVFTDQTNEERKALIEAIRPDHRVQFEWKGRQATIGKHGGRAADFLAEITSLEHAANPHHGTTAGGYHVKARKSGKNRSWHRSGEGVFMREYAPATTWVHEAAHSIEELDEVHELCKGFLLHRVGDEAPVLMRHVVPSANYDAWETGRKDDFLKTYLDTGLRDHEDAANSAYYAGKHYNGSTEILSMGAELLYEDPAGFARSDPEWFDFTVGVLTGGLL